MEIISIGKSSICKKETFHPSIFIFNILLFFNKEKKNSPKLKCVGKKVRPFIGAPVHLWLKIFLVYLKLGWKIRFSVLALFISTFRSSSMKIFFFFSLPLSNSAALALSFSATLGAHFLNTRCQIRQRCCFLQYAELVPALNADYFCNHSIDFLRLKGLGTRLFRGLIKRDTPSTILSLKRK